MVRVVDSPTVSVLIPILSNKGLFLVSDWTQTSVGRQAAVCSAGRLPRRSFGVGHGQLVGHLDHPCPRTTRARIPPTKESG